MLMVCPLGPYVFNVELCHLWSLGGFSSFLPLFCLWFPCSHYQKDVFIVKLLAPGKIGFKSQTTEWLQLSVYPHFNISGII